MPNGLGMEPPQPKRASVASARELPSAHVGDRDLGDRDLGAERHLIELAHAPLARGRADEALIALERHARRFPKGRLVEERESMRIATLVVLGRNDEAKRLAARFQARYPTSLFAPIVQQALQSIP